MQGLLVCLLPGRRHFGRAWSCPTSQRLPSPRGSKFGLPSQRVCLRLARVSLDFRVSVRCCDGRWVVVAWRTRRIGDALFPLVLLRKKHNFCSFVFVICLFSGQLFAAAQFRGGLRGPSGRRRRKLPSQVPRGLLWDLCGPTVAGSPRPAVNTRPPCPFSKMISLGTAVRPAPKRGPLPDGQ